MTDSQISTSPKPTAPFWQTTRRVLAGKCPNCGEGKLFRGYLKQVQSCASCAEEFGHIRADDGPAWLTMVVVGHVIAPLLALVVIYDFPVWVLMPAFIIPSTLLMLLMLPFSKGFFIGMIWRSGCIGSEK